MTQFIERSRIIRPFLLSLSVFLAMPALGQELHHYAFFNRDRERIREESFLNAAGFKGAQLKYSWKELEPAKGDYELEEIENDLTFLSKHGKRLFLQIQDVTFDTTRFNVPRYIMRDPEYDGGVDIQFYVKDGKRVVEGVVARRWDPEVQERLFLLLDTLGARFDGRIEGITLPETAINFGPEPAFWPKDYTPGAYRDGVILTMRRLRKAFPSSVAMQYANFMPGESLPEEDKSLLRDVYSAGETYDLALGGPDLLPWKPGQMRNTYRFMKEYRGRVTTGLAVQWGNFDHTNPKTGKRVTFEEMIWFAKNELGVKYLFWGTQEPYYTEEVLKKVGKN